MIITKNNWHIIYKSHLPQEMHFHSLVREIQNQKLKVIKHHLNNKILSACVFPIKALNKSIEVDSSRVRWFTWSWIMQLHINVQLLLSSLVSPFPSLGSTFNSFSLILFVLSSRSWMSHSSLELVVFRRLLIIKEDKEEDSMFSSVFIKCNWIWFWYSKIKQIQEAEMCSHG